jgi:hypothetical protein
MNVMTPMIWKEPEEAYRMVRGPSGVMMGFGSVGMEWKATVGVPNVIPLTSTKTLYWFPCTLLNVLNLAST